MKDGRDYIATSAVKSPCVVPEGAFRIAVVGLAHGHVYSLVGGLMEAGATLDCVYDPDPSKVAAFIERFGNRARAVSSLEEILSDKGISLVVNCVRPDFRADVSIRLLEAGKDVFSDKPGFLKVCDYQRIKDAVSTSHKHYLIYFSEHFHSEGMILAQQLVSSGKIGRVVHYEGFGPHRLNPATRPEWFFDPEKNGSVLLDLGCHLVEQFMCLTGCRDVEIKLARSLNLCHPEYPGFSDFGEMILQTPDGVSGYIRIDWLTPDGLSTWGDGRAFISGDAGYIEARKYLDVGHDTEGDNVILVTNEAEQFFKAKDKVGFDFFGKLILDCINGKSEATDYDLSLGAMRVSALAEQMARSSGI